MKYILLVPDGAADDSISDLQNKTPLEYAKTPNLDKLAAKGRVGSVLTVPEGMYPGSDVANMSLMGYDPRRYYTGRAPLEAVALEIPLMPKDVAFRISMVTTDGEKLLDSSAGHIGTDDARVLLELIQKKLGGRRWNFFTGVQYRHILRWTDGPTNMETTPAHTIQGQVFAPHLPVGEGAEELKQFIYDSLEILDGHEINKQRRGEGKNPANLLWPWGQGRTTTLPFFAAIRGLNGVMITAVDLLRGLAKTAGMAIVEVPGATGYIDTNYAGKAQYGLNALLSGLDFLYLHIESPDESGHEGNLDHKLQSIEDIDRKVVAPLIEGLEAAKEPFRLLVSPDHATPIALRTHRSGAVPFLLYDSENPARGGLPYDERALLETRFIVEEGYRLIDELLVPVR